MKKIIALLLALTLAFAVSAQSRKHRGKTI